MKLLKATVLFVGAIMLFSTSCKKDKKSDPAYTCTSCVKTPDALAVNDNSSKGIYKGIIIGSSGTIKFDLMNGGNTITAVMVIDGVTVNLTANVQWTNGNAYVAPFTGTLNGQAVTINFSVAANGTSPAIVSSNIPGHPNATFSLVKETSTGLIECFEGTYSTTAPENGTFNVFLSRDLKRWGGIKRVNGSTDAEAIEGTLNANLDILDHGYTIGHLDGDKMSGSFNNGTATVKFEGKRTL